MAFLPGVFSLWDERDWGFDSTTRSSTFRLEQGAVSLGEVSTSFDVDWYSLRLPGSGSFRITVSNDSLNDYNGNVRWDSTSLGVRVQVADAFGTVYTSLGSATGIGASDGTLTFTYTGGVNTTDYYVKVTNLGIGSADYALALELTGGITDNGTTGADSLVGSVLADSLSGGIGNDTLWGMAGDDILRGGSGDDLLQGWGGNDLLDGGDGTDVASYIEAGFGVTVNLAVGTASGGAGTDTLVGIERAWGSDFADTLVGSTGSNYLTGGAGNDSIAGAAGDDLLVGDAGNDTLDGGDGNDSAFFDATRASATVTYNAGLAQFSVSSTTDGTDVARNVETLFFNGQAYSAASLADPDTIAGSSATTAVLAIGSGSAASLGSAIDSNGDSDWIAVTLTAGTEYQFDLFGSAEDGGAGLGLTLADPYLFLRNSAGTSIVGNDDKGIGLNARIIHTPTVGGTYYLDVQESGNNATGTWRLFANVAPVSGSISVGGSVSGSVGTVGDVDDYSVTLDAGVTYTITLEGDTLANPFLEIADATGTVLDWDDDSGAGLDAQLRFTPSTSGTYYIAARESGHDATGSYLLSVANLDTIPGGTGSTATVTVGGSVRSDIDYGSDSDYFRVQLVAGTTYQFDLLGSVADGGLLGGRTLFDPWLALANAAGTLLAWNDDSGVGLNSRITYTPTASGTYFLIAEESGYDDTGSYQLLVNSSPLVGALAIGTPRTGGVDFTGDVDAYSITLNAGTTYRLTLQGNTLARPFLELLDASGAVVDYEDGGSGNLAQFDFTPGSTGAYQLLARDSGHDSTGSYTLTVAFPDSVPADVSSQSTLYAGKDDGEVTSSIDFAGDSDWWRAVLDSGYGYQIWLEGSSSGLGTLADPYLRVLNSAGAQQLSNDDLGAGTLDAYLYAVPTVGGTFFVSAEESGRDATGTYTLTLWRDALASNASATSVGVNSYHDERIGWMDDTSDWIAVSLSAGTTYQFDLIGSDGDGSFAGLTLFDPWLKLRSGAGLLLDEDDNSGLLGNARIAFTPSASGSYFLESYVPPGGDDSGTYRLIVNALPAITALTPGVPVNDELQFAGDVDQFSVTLTAGITYTFTLAGNTLGDPFLELLDSTRAVLTSDDDSGDGLDARLTYTPTASGTHYVSARASAHLSTGTYTVSVSASGVAAGAFESEDNNSSAAADPLAPGTRLSGALADRNDDDWFQLTVGAAGTLAIEFDAPTNSTLDYFRIGVWDGANHRLANFVTGSDQTYQVSAPAAGSYFVVVDSAQQHSSGSYGLKVTHTAGGSGIESEPNEVHANALLSGSAIAGQLATAADVDWFYFATTTPSELALVFDAPTNSALTDYFQIRVLDAAGNLLASRAGGSDLAFIVAAPAAGNYFISVSTASDSAHDTGTYRLTATASASSTLREVEPNNAVAEANAVPLPGAIKGQLSGVADADGYLVTTTGAGTLSVRLDAPTASTWGSYFRVAVHAPDGTLIGSRETGGDIAFEVDVSLAGSHRVVVSTATLYSGGEYELAVSAVVNDSTPAGAIQGTPAADTLVGTAGADTIAGLGGNDLIDGGAGNDTAFFRTALANLSINTIEGLTAVRGNNAAGEHAYSASRLWNVERISTSGGITLLGNASASPRLGTAQADQITGSVAADLIDGLGGSDFIDGGAGSDTLVLFGPSAAFSVLTVAGITRIRGDQTTFEYAGHTIRTVNVERLAYTQSQVRTLEVTATNKLFGSAGADTLIGTGAADVIDAGGGNDSVDGGAGSDTLVFFGRRDEFTIAFPSASDSAVRVTGKSGGEYAGQTVRALNVESLAFSDGVVGITNPPGVVATPATTLIAEGGAAAVLGVSLRSAPSANVTVRLAGGAQLDTNATALTFTTANWNQAQSVSVSAKDDSAAEKQHTGTLSLSVESADAGYGALGTTTIDYTITDNDSAALGAVAGRLWNDADRDGAIDAGEAALVGWRVFDDVNRNGSLDSGEAFVVTDTSGAYRLNDLAAGAHVIVARPEPGWVATAPGGGASVSSTVIQNQAGSGFDGIGRNTSAALGLDVQAAATDYTNLGSATRIAEFHADPRFAGIQGRGYAVVVIDTGADLDHPDFGPDGNGDGVADRIVHQFDFSGANDPSAADTNGHGTHVAGTIGSSDAAFPGIASEVSLIVLKVSPDNSNSMSRDDVREALNWVVQNHAQHNVVSVNLSLGGGEFHRVATTGWYSSQIYALTAAGVTVVAASGNSYDDNPVQGVAYPSSDPYALSVGAVWAVPGTWGNLQTGVTDALVVFSQRDDSESDVFAPGGHVVATQMGGGHVQMSGTSMASPQIAGMVALAQQVADQYLGRRLTFFELRELLQASGDAIVDGDDENDTVPNTGLTFKRVDMLSLAEAVIALKPPTAYTVTVSAGNTVADRNFGFAGSPVVQGLADDDLIAGTYLGDILRGGGGNDRIDGGADNDAVYGELGDDDLTPGTGDDLIDGGDGDDRVIFLARRDAFTISYDSASATYTLVSASTGRDQVRSVEFFEFSNGTLAAAQLIDSTAPTLASTLPADGAANVASGANLVLTFNEPVEWGSGVIELKTSAGATVETFNGASPAARASLSGAVLTLDATAALVNGTSYRLEIGAGALKDLAGNTIAANDSFDFTVTSANVAPTASSGNASVAEDAVLNAQLPAATDANGDAISYSKVSDPAHGTLTVNANGSYIYAPAANYNGSDSFGFRVVDPSGVGNSYTVNLSVTPVNDLPGGSVTISGTARVGQTLSAAQAVTDVDGLGTLAYQWLRGGAAIDGATGTSYTLVAADVGSTLSVRVSYTDGGGTFESLTSATTAPVQDVNLITGTAGDNPITGTSGADSIRGLAGNDVLNGGSGSDTLDGGEGFDVASWGLDGSNTPINASLLSGTVTQGSDIDTLIGIEALFATAAADNIRAADGPANQRGETIRGGQGNDTIDGGTGVDAAEFVGARTGYTITRTGNAITVQDNNDADGRDGTDSLLNVERLVFANTMLAFGTRAEELARVAFVLWTPLIVDSRGLFSRGYSYYDNGGYDFATMCAAALSFHGEQDMAFAQKLKNNMPGTAKTVEQIFATMRAAGGGEPGRIAALIEMTNDPATELALVNSNIRTTGIVADLVVPGFGTLFGLLPGA